MKNFLKMVVLFLSAFVIGHLSAQAGSGVNAVASTQSVDAAGQDIAVTVNGIVITKRQIEAELKLELERLLPGAKGKRVPDAIVQPYKKRLRQLVFERTIEKTLLNEKVKEAGIVVSDQEVDDEIKRRAARVRPPVSVEEYKARVEGAEGGGIDALKQRIRRDLVYRKFFQRHFAVQLNIPEADAKKYYAENQTRYDLPEEVRVSHITINPKDFESEGINPPAAKAKAAARAEELLKQIKAGADFGKLASENATGSSGKKGGDLGYFRKGQLPVVLDEVVFALEVGQVSPVLETGIGYQIIKVTGRKAAVSGFDKVKNDVMEDLKARKLSELSSQYVKILKAEAKIVYPPGKGPEPDNPPVSGIKVTPLKAPAASNEKPAGH